MRIIGFRAHLLDKGGQLNAINSSFGHWIRGQNEAQLGKPYTPAGWLRTPDNFILQGARPEIDVSMPHGFHAYYRWGSIPTNEPISLRASPFYIGSYPYIAMSHQVISAVTGWGRMVLHADGWRSQFAEIHAVLSTQDRAKDDLIRKRYDVPVLMYPDELLEVALSYGMEITDPAADIEGVKEIKRANADEAPGGYYCGRLITVAQLKWLQTQPGFPWTSGSHLAPVWSATNSKLATPSFSTTVWVSTGSLTATATGANYAEAKQRAEAGLEALVQAAAKTRKARFRLVVSLLMCALALTNTGLILTNHIPQLLSFVIDSFTYSFLATFWFGSWTWRQLRRVGRWFSSLPAAKTV